MFRTNVAATPNPALWRRLFCERNAGVDPTTTLPAFSLRFLGAPCATTPALFPRLALHRTFPHPTPTPCPVLLLTYLFPTTHDQPKFITAICAVLHYWRDSGVGPPPCGGRSGLRSSFFKLMLAVHANIRQWSLSPDNGPAVQTRCFATCPRCHARRLQRRAPFRCHTTCYPPTALPCLPTVTSLPTPNCAVPLPSCTPTTAAAPPLPVPRQRVPLPILHRDYRRSPAWLRCCSPSPCRNAWGGRWTRWRYSLTTFCWTLCADASNSGATAIVPVLERFAACCWHHAPHTPTPTRCRAHTPTVPPPAWRQQHPSTLPTYHYPPTTHFTRHYALR